MANDLGGDSVDDWPRDLTRTEFWRLDEQSRYADSRGVELRCQFVGARVLGS